MTDQSLLRLRFGVDVEGSDGPLGVLHHVLVHPGTGCVRGLGFRTGFLVPHEIRVPWKTVLSATEFDVRLSLTSVEAHSLQGGRCRNPRSAPTSCKAENGTALHWLSDMLPVRVSGGAVVGHLRLLLVAAESGEIREYVIESGLFTRQSRRLPAGCVGRITPTALEVEISPAELAGLPAFRGDQELRADILNAWFYDDRVRLTLLQAPVDVHVTAGIARVEGYAATREIGQRLEARARSVPGVARVEGGIVTDDVLAPEVTSALAEDPRTQALCPQVRSCLGVITLQGDAPDLAAYEAASEVATSVPGVGGVINRLRIQGPGGPPVLIRHLRAWLERHPGSPAGAPPFR